MLGGNKNDRNIKDLLGEVIGSNRKLNRGVSQIRIEEAWAKQMGDIISSYTTRLYFREGTLTVNLTSAPLRSELAMSKQQCIDLLNEECGEEVVKDLILK